MNKIFASIFIFVFCLAPAFAQNYGDAVLKQVRAKDQSSRNADGRLQTLSAAEHAYRADVYSSNRYFKEAREHWQKILDNYRTDSSVMPKTLFGIARSYMWERQYDKAVSNFDALIKDYLNTKDGREGLAFKGASLIRLGKNLEAAKTYEQYATMFPTGERIETSHLNIIDALREAKKYDEANLWVDKTRQRFSGMPTATNALFARMRMEIFRENWQKAISTADELRNLRNFSGSMTSIDEVTYLKALALEKSNRKNEAVVTYNSLPNIVVSYHGGLANERLAKLNAPRSAPALSSSSKYFQDYPAPFRTELLQYAKSKNVDPRFLLAIMKQESGFRPQAKSPAAARGLLQLVYDTALKYNKQAGFPALQAEDLYRPNVNIAIGSFYVGELKNEFDDLYEAIAASYNGGEDNAARWLARSKPKDPAIFTAEVGFAETKDYVFKVMNNYRVYRELYTEDLNRK